MRALQRYSEVERMVATLSIVRRTREKCGGPIRLSRALRTPRGQKHCSPLFYLLLFTVKTYHDVERRRRRQRLWRQRLWRQRLWLHRTISACCALVHAFLCLIAARYRRSLSPLGGPA